MKREVTLTSIRALRDEEEQVLAEHGLKAEQIISRLRLGLQALRMGAFLLTAKATDSAFEAGGFGPRPLVVTLYCLFAVFIWWGANYRAKANVVASRWGPFAVISVDYGFVMVMGLLPTNVYEGPQGRARRARGAGGARHAHRHRRAEPRARERGLAGAEDRRRSSHRPGGRRRAGRQGRGPARVHGDRRQREPRLAHRGLTKVHQVDILVSEGTWSRLGARFVGQPCGEEKVKGRAEPVRIHAVTSRTVASGSALT